MMNWKDIRVLYAREVLSALRERTIVTNSILIPLLLYPPLIWLMYTGFSFVSGQNEELTSRVMLKNLPEFHESLRSAIESDRSMEIATAVDPTADIGKGSLDALIEFSPPTSGSLALENNLQARITYDESRDRSGQARNRLVESVSKYRQDFIEQQASTFGVSRSEIQRLLVFLKERPDLLKSQS